MNINQVVFENIYNKERFYSISEPASKIVDGVEYIRVCKVSTQKEVFIRKDSLQIVQSKQKTY